MEAGEILEEEEVIPEEEEVIPEEEEVIPEEEEVTPEEGEEIRPLRMTNSQGNSPQSSKAIAESLRHLCRNGPFIEASIDSPLK